MNSYEAPLRDMHFVLEHVAGLHAVAQLKGNEEIVELAHPVLEEAAAFAKEVLDPINQSGDRQGCRWEDGRVTTPRGFKEAYRRFAEAGWIGLPVSQQYGGQGLPQLLLAPTLEMWHAANVGFANAPLLNQAAIEAIELSGSTEQKALFIPKLVSGEWMGTMALTEPQAGSDLAAVRTRAIPQDGAYRVTGQKIFITFGEHDLAENIIHLVLARLPDAPPGVKGISLFIVPKFVINADGSCGERNDVTCTGIEHKLGLGGNPTCTMNYGEAGGAVAYLVGEPNRGLEYMFVMMNAARFSVGVQALGIAERAYQRALAYARERVQSRDLASASTQAVPIVEHPDVRRMLLTMKSQIEAMRALGYVTAASIDFAHRASDEAQREKSKAISDFLTPVVKGWCTEVAQEICSLAIQVFGGIGYVEETGVAQHFRDVRVTTIYEGTTGIQGLDFAMRKVLRDRGAVALQILDAIDQAALAGANETTASISDALKEAASSLRHATQWMVETAASDPRAAAASSVPFLKLWGVVLGGRYMAEAARIAGEQQGAADDFYAEKVTTAAVYAAHVLVQAATLERQVVEGAPTITSARL